jgi:hypothetical protein
MASGALDAVARNNSPTLRSRIGREPSAVHWAVDNATMSVPSSTTLHQRG